MPYRKETFSPHNYFHIFCRGNDKKDIFLDHDDYEHFLSRAKKYAKLHRITIICYCLMPNHFHFLLRQNTKQPISFFMQRLSVSHAMFFNRRHKRSGHLFGSNFKAKIILENDYLLHLSCYIHLNPLKMINCRSDLETYRWSSYSEYLGQNKKDGICDKEIILGQFRDGSTEYKKIIEKFVPSKELEKYEEYIT
ncbi:MAG: transposase [Candidatus Omnitrophica bacterium]|nr:transposase [Candidatus Omnitrophota bacterium]